MAIKVGIYGFGRIGRNVLRAILESGRTDIEVIEIKVDHQQRLDGDTQVYKLTKMPSIIIRNFIGLIKLRLSK